MFSAMHFIYYINKLIATKVDSTLFGREPVTSRSLVRRLADGTTQVLLIMTNFNYYNNYKHFI